jgi:hypothetical protein
MRYVSDFGADWVHKVVVEKVLQADSKISPHATEQVVCKGPLPSVPCSGVSRYGVAYGGEGWRRNSF